ncbi:MAG: hypothetical protein MJ025_04095 [Victivallaceae bacterium]|nr:hypothetical protein [Victivallaceae bacterium]
MQYLGFALAHLALLAFYGLFGMTLFPGSVRETEDRNELFAIAPLMGAGVWLALTVGIGTVVPYGAPFLCASLAAMAAWIVHRRKALFLPDGARLWALAAVIVILSSLMSYGIAPHEENGGIYFLPCIYDHIKAAIVDSISAHGLPPVNPWLADGGHRLPLVYYYGWHAWVAQLPILTGCDAFFAECAMTGFTFAIVMLGTAGFAGFCDKRMNWGWAICLIFLIFSDFEYADLASSLLPKSWTAVFSTEGIPGFWNLLNNSVWAPQHMFAASMVLLVLCVHGALLRSDKTADSAPLTVLLGILAAAALLNSVYSGAFALVVVGMVMAYAYCADGDFRGRFNVTFLWQVAALAICLALTAAYLAFMFSYPSEKCPLEFGIMPCFGKVEHFWQYPVYFLQFYFAILPMRLGITYVLGVLAIFLPGVLPKHQLVDFFRKYAVLCLLSVFFMHSTFYSNDFGWRILTIPQLIFAVLSVHMLHWFWCQCVRIIKPKWIVTITAVLLCALMYLASTMDYYAYRSLQKFDPALHRAFARAVPAWDVVRSHTSRDDLVLCNPAGFYEIGKIYNSSQSTNVFFSVYAHRDTPIADLIFSKCYSEFSPQDRLEKIHGRVVAVFSGNPSRADADYLADELKTRALVVTPLDGLWSTPGEIERRFPNKEETNDYRVYWN